MADAGLVIGQTIQMPDGSTWRVNSRGPLVMTLLRVSETSQAALEACARLPILGEAVDACPLREAYLYGAEEAPNA